MPGRPEGGEVFDVAVVGDEVESVITAVSAARAGARTALVTPVQAPGPGAWLGGLCTRGGLCYMDITPGYFGPLFAEFLQRAGVRRVALEAVRAHQALAGLLREAEVSIVSLQGPTPCWQPDDRHWRLHAKGPVGLRARMLIDATPDATLARALGVGVTEGLGGLFGPEANFLGVTPVFQTQGVDREGLMAFEASLRQHPQATDWLADGLPHLSDAQRKALLTRAVESPPDEDYIDILNPLIGVAFHVWRGGQARNYPHAEMAIDGFNIARLSGGVLGWNGLVMRGRDLASLLAWSQELRPFPPALYEAMAAFERFLQEAGGFTQARLIMPQALYVRQTVNIRARSILTAAQALAGGVPPEQAVGTYSYWLDLRGIVLAQHYPGETLAKPIFNVGLDPAWAVLPGGPAAGEGRFAVVGRSAGYSPLAQGAGRIIQHNALLGEAVGVAAALAMAHGTPMPAVAPADVRAVLQTRGEVRLSGQAVQEADAISASRLLQADCAVVWHRMAQA